MYTRKVLFALILDFFSLHKVRISMYMSRKADKSYMYYLFVLVKIKIREIGKENFGKFSSYAYFEDQTFWKNLGNISDVYNLSEICFPCFAYFCTDPSCEWFPKIVEVHKLSEFYFQVFLILYWPNIVLVFFQNNKNMVTKFGKDYAVRLFDNIIKSDILDRNINTCYNFVYGLCL